MHISSADKKEKPWFLKALKTRRNPFFDKTVRKTGFIHMDRDVAFVRIGFYKIDLIPLAGFTVMTS